MQGIKAGKILITAMQIHAYLTKEGNTFATPGAHGKLEKRHFEVLELTQRELEMRPQSEEARVLYDKHIRGTMFCYAFLCPGEEKVQE